MPAQKRLDERLEHRPKVRLELRKLSDDEFARIVEDGDYDSGVWTEIQDRRFAAQRGVL